MYYFRGYLFDSDKSATFLNKTPLQNTPLIGNDHLIGPNNFIGSENNNIWS